VSEKNGDRARFARERWKKVFRRQRTRELLAAPKREQTGNDMPRSGHTDERGTAKPAD
jgi:hypothetical protein